MAGHALVSSKSPFCEVVLDLTGADGEDSGMMTLKIADGRIETVHFGRVCSSRGKPIWLRCEKGNFGVYLAYQEVVIHFEAASVSAFPGRKRAFYELEEVDAAQLIVDDKGDTFRYGIVRGTCPAYLHKKRESTGLPVGFKLSERKHSREGSAEGGGQMVASPTSNSARGGVARTSTRTPRGARGARQRGGRGSARGSRRSDSTETEIHKMADMVGKLEVRDRGAPQELKPVVFSLSSSEDEEVEEKASIEEGDVSMDMGKEGIHQQDDRDLRDEENTADYFRQMFISLNWVPYHKEYFLSAEEVLPEVKKLAKKDVIHEKYIKKVFIFDNPIELEYVARVIQLEFKNSTERGLRLEQVGDGVAAGAILLTDEMDSQVVGLTNPETAKLLWDSYMSQQELAGEGQ